MQTSWYFKVKGRTVSLNVDLILLLSIGRSSCSCILAKFDTFIRLTTACHQSGCCANFKQVVPQLVTLCSTRVYKNVQCMFVETVFAYVSTMAVSLCVR